MIQVAITNSKAGGYTHRWDNFGVTVFHPELLQGGNVLSLGKELENGSFNAKYPIVVDRLEDRQTEHWTGEIEHGHSLASKNYIVVNDQSADLNPLPYASAVILESGDVYTVSKNAFDGVGTYGVFQPSSFRLLLVEKRPNKGTFFKILKESTLMTDEERIPSFLVEFRI
jgi:hypothetical protein